MRWRMKATPQTGEKRWVTRFLFLPVCIEGECRWLERVMILQSFVRYNARDGWWVNERFAD